MTSSRAGLSDSQTWMVLAGGAAFLILLYLLAPILSPFATAMLFAYIGDPLVDRLEARRLPRPWAVTVVFVAIFLSLLLLAGLLFPLLQGQVVALLRKLPSYVDWVQTNVVPRASMLLGVEEEHIGLATIRESLAGHWRVAGGWAVGVISDLSQSGAALLASIANLVLVPVVTFYLLRDWDVLVARVHELLPRSVEPLTVKLTVECDRVLAEFLRGQLLVMAALAAVYAGGLTAMGLELGLLIGLVAGLVSFVPYLGFVVGILAALVAAFFQFHEFLPMLYVVVVFGIGQALEGMWLTPLLVGDRIGLHPVAVIFAVMAGGQLFGFLGILLALPTAAIVVVILREVHRRYLASGLYS